MHGECLLKFNDLSQMLSYLLCVTHCVEFIDIDGDDITIDSDQDLITAFKEMSGPLKIFYITVLKVKPDAASPLQRHSKILLNKLPYIK